jgi:hypothetical protein
MNIHYCDHCRSLINVIVRVGAAMKTKLTEHLGFDEPTMRIGLKLRIVVSHFLDDIYSLHTSL